MRRKEVGMIIAENFIHIYLHYRDSVIISMKNCQKDCLEIMKESSFGDVLFIHAIEICLSSICRI